MLQSWMLDELLLEYGLHYFHVDVEPVGSLQPAQATCFLKCGARTRTLSDAFRKLGSGGEELVCLKHCKTTG